MEFFILLLLLLIGLKLFFSNKEELQKKIDYSAMSDDEKIKTISTELEKTAKEIRALEKYLNL